MTAGYGLRLSSSVLALLTSPGGVAYTRTE